MSARHVAGEVFAALCTICWALVPAPQVWKNWREKTTEGLSPFLPLIWIFTLTLIAAYAIVEGLSGGLIAQPFITNFMFAIVIWQILYYDPKNNRDWRKPSLYTLLLVVVFAGTLVGLIFGLRAAEAAGVNLDWFAYLTTVFGIAGVIPQYYEVWKFQRVIGLSLGLCILDSCGAIFGATSVALSTDPLNVAGFVVYIVYAPFTGTLIPLHYILEARWRRLHPEGDVQRVTDIEVIAEVPEMKEEADKETREGGSSNSVAESDARAV
ncbi:hypothetical protein DFJ74DRAFT_774926 [Hyaloraphidium curvatum]|nr:hypothetical protein DFJ74DRAFT_774926 [Hyaloraphidium curvatum]